MSQVRYTIGTISSNRTQFNTAVIWLIRVQLSVILPGFDLSLSAKKAEMIFFTLVISQPNISCQMIFRSNKFKTYSQTQHSRDDVLHCWQKGGNYSSIWGKLYLCTFQAKTLLYYVLRKWWQWTSYLLPKWAIHVELFGECYRHTFRKVFRSWLHYFKIFRSSLDTWCSNFWGRNFQKFFSIEPYELIFSILSISRLLYIILYLELGT